MADGKCHRCKELDSNASGGFCVECRRQYDAERRSSGKSRSKKMPKELRQQYLKRNMEFLREAKNRLCADCKLPHPYWRMQFDHRDPATKTYEINDIRQSRKKLIKEIGKCDVVCANCHADRTQFRRTGQVPPT